MGFSLLVRAGYSWPSYLGYGYDNIYSQGDREEQMRPWVGELFPRSKTQMQGGNMATGSFGRALGSRSLCPFVLLFSGENGVTDRTVGWN